MLNKEIYIHIYGCKMQLILVSFKLINKKIPIINIMIYQNVGIDF